MTNTAFQSGDICSFPGKQITLFVYFPNISDIDECSTDSCHGKPTRNNAIGYYVCPCDTGYSADGL